MKMGTGIFWGIILILIGLGLVIRVVFNVEFPLFKIIIAFFLIFLGLRLLFGGSGIFGFHTGENDVLFSEKRFENPRNLQEYNVVFGKGNFYFSGKDLSQSSVKIRINTIFGGSTLHIPRDMPVVIRANAVFGGAELPDGNTAVFGSSTYKSEKFNPGENHLDIKADVVFGGLQVSRD